MITDERAEQAFEYLRDTSEKIGAAKGRLERAEIMRKRVRKRLMLTSTAATVALREAEAETGAETQECDDEYIAAISDYETLRAKRDIEAIALEVWRTESANRRRM